MGLIYDEETAVPRDAKTEDDALTAYLNDADISGRTQDIQNDFVVHVHLHNTVGAGTVRTNTTADMVLSCLNYQTANANFDVFINGTKISRWTQQVNNPTVNMPVPNWVIPAGSEIKSTSDGAGILTLNLIGRT